LTCSSLSLAGSVSASSPPRPALLRQPLVDIAHIAAQIGDAKRGIRFRFRRDELRTIEPCSPDTLPGTSPGSLIQALPIFEVRIVE